MSGLFREQVIERHRQRLHGRIMIDNPASFAVPTLLACLAMAAVIAFLCLCSVSRTEETTGWLVPDKGLLQIKAPQSGVVVDLRAKPGQRVEAGEIVAVLSSERVSTKGDTQHAVGALLEQRVASLNLESDQLARQFVSQREALHQRLRGLGEELRQVNAELDVQEQRGELVRNSQQRLQELLAQGFVSESHVKDRAVEALEHAARVAALRRSAAQVQERLEQARSEERDLPLHEQRETAQLHRSIDELRQQQSENEARRQVLVRAPRAGRVAGVTVRSGQTVSADAPLSSLVPEGSVLQAELSLPSRSMGFVRIGTPVWLRYDAYPYQMFGQHQGTVVGIDVGVTAEDGHVQHRVQVRLASDEVRVPGQAYPLMPGLAVSASLRLEKRRLIDWMFDPLKRWAAPQDKGAA